MEAFSSFLGGLGLFLLGMSLMTSGLKKLAGRRLHDWLGRATRTPLTGVVTGASMSAVIQSSSATILAAMGFVGAGLLSFASGLGIIIGANIGTTLTGWLVAVLGFKLSFGTIAMPLLCLAAFLYLFRDRPGLDGIGKSLSGFCLLFLGLDLLQAGLAGLEQHLALDAFAQAGLPLALVLGVVFALVTQSSSATVAASLTALHTGFLDLPQAIAVIIGADIGTTATAALATIGARTAARRAGFAHVIYNLITGIGAFCLLPLYLRLANLLGPVAEMPEVFAVLYHSLFNIVGVFVVLPVLPRFAALLERLIPEEEDPLTAALDPRLLKDPNAAQAALQHTLAGVGTRLFARLEQHVSHPLESPSSFDSLRSALCRSREFVLEMERHEEAPSAAVRRAAIHIIDHSERLLERLEEHPEIPALAELPRHSTELAGAVTDAEKRLQGESHDAAFYAALQKIATGCEADNRPELINLALRRRLSGEQLDQGLDAARWLQHSAWHVLRITDYWSEIVASGKGRKTLADEAALDAAPAKALI